MVKSSPKQTAERAARPPAKGGRARTNPTDASYRSLHNEATRLERAKFLPDEVHTKIRLEPPTITMGPSLHRHEVPDAFRQVLTGLYRARPGLSSEKRYIKPSAPTQLLMHALHLNAPNEPRSVAAAWRIASTPPGRIFGPANTNVEAFHKSKVRHLWLAIILTFGCLWRQAATAAHSLAPYFVYPPAQPLSRTSRFGCLIDAGLRAVEVTGDGNCGYYSILIGLHRLGKLQVDLGRWVSEVVSLRRLFQEQGKELLKKGVFATTADEVSYVVVLLIRLVVIHDLGETKACDSNGCM